MRKNIFSSIVWNWRKKERVSHALSIQQRKRQKTAKLLLHAGSIASGLILLLAFYFYTAPSTGTVTYKYEGRETQTTDFPFFVPSQSNRIDVDFTMNLSSLYPTLFHIKPDNCIERATINNTDITDVLRFCDFSGGAGKLIHLGPYLRSGSNTFSFSVFDDGGEGGLSFAPARTDPLNIFILGLFVGLICLAFPLAVRFFPALHNRRAIILFALFMIGVLVRFGYLLSTPYSVRGYDTVSHIEYIQYVADHFRVPKIAEGWQFYQPPLYYFFSALTMSIGRFLGRSQSLILHDLQVQSLILSIAMFAICFWIARMLYPRKQHSLRPYLFIAILAVFPGFVYLSSRITNDLFVQFFSFIAFAFLLRWWQSNRPLDWFMAIVAIALGILSKNNALPLVAIAFTCLLFKRISWKEKLKLSIGGIAVLLLLTDWIFIMRYMEGNAKIVANVGNLNGALQVQNTLGAYLRFDPSFLLSHPYNNPWIDADGRQYFWQFLFRSAFFGEFQFPQVMRNLNVLIIFLALFSFIFVIIGMVYDLLKRGYERLPLLLCLIFLLAAHAVYRFNYPFAPSQDFRYIVLVVIPMTYYAVEGASILPPFLRRISSIILATFSILLASFFALLFFMP